MKKKLLNSILILSVIPIVSLSFFNIYSLNKKNNEFIDLLIKNKRELKEKTDLVSSYFKIDSIQMELSNLKLSKSDIKVYQDDKNYSNSIKLSNKLILIIPKYGCSPCIDSTIQLLKEYVLNSKIDKNNVVLLIEEDKNQDIDDFKRINKLDYPIYYYEFYNNKLKSVCNYNYPCIFNLNDKQEVNDFFISYISLINRTIIYFKNLDFPKD